MPKKSTNQILPDMSELTGLPPLAGDHPEILVLGTFPGCCSLCKGEYYADRGNSFRKIMADILNKGIPFKTYAEFETCLKKTTLPYGMCIKLVKGMDLPTKTYNTASQILWKRFSENIIV